MPKRKLSHDELRVIDEALNIEYQRHKAEYDGPIEHLKKKRKPKTKAQVKDAVKKLAEKKLGSLTQADLISMIKKEFNK